MDRQKVLNIKLQMKSEGVKLACLKCGEMPQNIDKHLKDVHDVRSSADWLRNIRIMKPGEDNLLSTIATATVFTPASSPHLNKLMSLINTVDKK
uniref:C2H2-type domain-containing protein n=1 Tax=Heterorhabditis bacteriophora TaxID=37862 RepID=A0A1I7XMI9_HETBA